MDIDFHGVIELAWLGLSVNRFIADLVVPLNAVHGTLGGVWLAHGEFVAASLPVGPKVG